MSFNKESCMVFFNPCNILVFYLYFCTLKNILIILIKPHYAATIQNRFVSQNARNFTYFSSKPITRQVCTYLNAFLMVFPNIFTKFQNFEKHLIFCDIFYCRLLTSAVENWVKGDGGEVHRTHLKLNADVF